MEVRRLRNDEKRYKKRGGEERLIGRRYDGRRECFYIIEIGRREDYGREQDGTEFVNNIKRR